MGTKYSTNAASGYNATPPADDGTVSEANKVKYSTVKTKLSDPIKDLVDTINTELVAHFNNGPTSLTSNTTLGASHYNQIIQVSGAGVTLTLSDASTLAAGWYCEIVNTDTSNIVILGRATGADTLNGVASNVALVTRARVKVFVNAAGNGFYTVPDIRQIIPTPRFQISGLTYSNNGSDATNDIDLAVGEATDSTGAMVISLSSALTKRSDATWAVGTNQGWLDTGAIGNSDYYIWLILRSDTGVVDSLCSLSSTDPTMPTSYDYKRLIGWFKRVGGTIVAFKTYETEGGGIELNWDVPTLDVNLANTLTTSRRTDAVKVPLNFSTVAHLNVLMSDAAGSFSWVYCPDQTDQAPSTSVAPLFNIIQQGGTANSLQMRIRTSSTGTIAARSNTATVDLYAVSTMGFTWARRN